MRKDLIKTFTLTISKTDDCWKKENHGRCCCNCSHHHAVNGHPWVTDSSITTPTGLFTCSCFADMGEGTDHIASAAHGACECWDKL